MLLDLYEGFDYFESSHKFDIVYPKRPILPHECVTYSKLPSTISTMSRIEHILKTFLPKQTCFPAPRIMYEF